MRLNKFLVGLVTLCSSSLCADLIIPDESTIALTRMSSTLTAFDIESTGGPIGTINRFLGDATHHDIYNSSAGLEATADSDFTNYGWVFNIADTNPIPLAQLTQNVFTIRSTFGMVSSGEVVLAVATANIWDNLYSLRDPATMEEMVQIFPTAPLSNVWTIKIVNRTLFDQKGFDSRAFYHFIACQADQEMCQTNMLALKQFLQSE